MDYESESRVAVELSQLTLSDQTSNFNFDVNSDHIFQVLKAVEAAEITIKQQEEENSRLRAQLIDKIQKIEKHKVDISTVATASVYPWNACMQSSANFNSIVPSYNSQNGEAWSAMCKNSVGSHGALVFQNSGGNERDEHLGGCHCCSTAKIALSHARHQSKSDGEPWLHCCRDGLIYKIEEDNGNTSWKQHYILKIREQEQEISRLKMHLENCFIKETQLQNEKFVLEKRIAYMRQAFDQQQKDTADAAMKALSYRQEIIEENIRLTYELQAVHEEKMIFVSSLLPLLTGHSLQPPVPDAQSISANIRILLRSINQRLSHSESKLKEFQVNLAPEYLAKDSPTVECSSLNDADQSSDADPSTSMKAGFNFFAESPLSSEEQQISLPAPTLKNPDLPDYLKSGLGDPHGKLVCDNLGRYSPITNSTDNNDVGIGEQQIRSHPDWPSSNVLPTSSTDDHDASFPPTLPAVLEEPLSSFSDSGNAEYFPAIEGLQISGEAFPGHELQACGYSINGTTSCNFEWVRHFEDGSVNYIDGAKQPNYLVTADDVDTYLAIEVQPLDDMKRKGKLVKVFANEHRKITCDPEMQSNIQRHLYNGNALFQVSLATGYLDIWESAILAIKRDCCNIKCNGPSNISVSEKFSQTTVTIPYGRPTEFVIIGSSGAERTLRVDGTSNSNTSTRDLIVLTLRLFILRACERGKGRKKSLFFNKQGVFFSGRSPRE